MTDDVGFEHWSCYQGNVPTPNIDQVAREGMRFNQAYTTSAACTPSRFSIMTGQFPGRCSDEKFIKENSPEEPYTITWNTPITINNLTLHELLNQAGYFTGFVGKFHIGQLDFDKHETNSNFPSIPDDLSPESSQADSFLALYQSLISKEVKQLTGANYVASVLWENSEEVPLNMVRNHNLEWITSGGIDFLENIPEDQPFFLHFNTTCLHGPNHYDNLKADARYTPEGKKEKSYQFHPERESIFNRLDSLGIAHGSEVPDHINHYNAGILYMDDQIGAILRKLDELEHSENTLLIITADHNIEPGKSTVYNKGVHVPFIVKWPGNIQAGSTSNELISFVDFLPTFADVAGADLPREPVFDGISFLPALKGRKLNEREFIYFEEGYTRGITDGEIKYIAMRFPEHILYQLENGEKQAITHLGSELHGFGYIAQEYHPGYFDADQLYDLRIDPYEQINLSGDPDYGLEKIRMKAALDEILAEFDHPFDLEDTSFESMPEYAKAAQTVKERGTDFIPWWNRTLEYPPKQK